MKKSSLALAVIAAFSASVALADNTCNHGCNSGGGGDPTSVTATGGSSTAFGGTGIGLGGTGIGSASATGGQGGNASATGGQGGAGGTGIGTAALIDSGNSSSTAASSATQGQGQLQGQSTTVAGSGNSRTANANNSAQSVNISTPAPYIPVNTAYAAPLTAGEQTCMGSSSGGVQGPGFGLSVGSTWTDGNCVALRDSARAQTLGMKDVAVAIMCQQAVFAKAMKATGHECPSGVRKVAEAQNNALPDVGDRDLRPDWVRGE